MRQTYKFPTEAPTEVKTMTETTLYDADAPILVEFAPLPQTGVRQVSLRPGEIPQELAEKSARALDSAMDTIRAMAHRVTETVRGIQVSERPHEVAVEFGLKLDAEAGAYIAKAGTEAGFKVTLTWQRVPAAKAEADAEDEADADA